MTEQIKEAYGNKMKNKLYGLLCEYEKGRDWEGFLDAILIELAGWPDSKKTINFYSLYYKLSEIKYLDYKYFRKTIFDCIELFGKI